MLWPHTKTHVVCDEYLRELSNFDCQLTIGYGDMKIACACRKQLKIKRPITIFTLIKFDICPGQVFSIFNYLLPSKKQTSAAN
jgi:hypothetical protein